LFFHSSSTIADTTKKVFSTTGLKPVIENNFNDKIWYPINMMAFKIGYSKDWPNELFNDPRYSDFLSKHSRFEKFPAAIILFIR